MRHVTRSRPLGWGTNAYGSRVRVYVVIAHEGVRCAGCGARIPAGVTLTRHSTRASGRVAGYACLRCVPVSLRLVDVWQNGAA